MEIKVITKVENDIITRFKDVEKTYYQVYSGERCIQTFDEHTLWLKNEARELNFKNELEYLQYLVKTYNQEQFLEINYYGGTISKESYLSKNLANYTAGERKKAGLIKLNRIKKYGEAFITVKGSYKNGIQTYTQYSRMLNNKQCLPIIYYKDSSLKRELENSLLDFNFNSVNISSKDYDTIKDFRDNFNLVSAFNLINNKYVKCLFLKYATIAKAKENRVIIKNEIGLIIMDIVDILDLLDINLVDFVINNNIVIKEIQPIVQKYVDLVNTINDKGFESNYPHVQQYLGIENIKILEEFCILGKKLISKSILVDNKDFIFYTSTRYFAELLNSKNSNIKIDYTAVSRILNVFCVLGLYNKHFSPEDFKCVLRDDTIKRTNEINYFSINDISWDSAEARAIKLLDNKVYVGRISSINITEVFGQDLADSVFQKTKKPTTTKKKTVKKTKCKETINSNKFEVIEEPEKNEIDEDMPF